MRRNLLGLKWLAEVMRVCTLQIVMVLIVGGTALAYPNYAQVLDREITINLSGITLEKALRELESKAEIKFVYSPERFKLNEIISIYADHKKLRDILQDLLTPRNIEFAQDGETNFVILRPAKKKGKITKQTSSVTDQPTASPSEREPYYVAIAGTVIDGSINQPLPGVNVIVKGTTNGTNTDANGQYSINANADDVLVFSFIGFASQEIKVTGQTRIDVSLREDAARLNEVVVNAGYYNILDREKTGSISRVTSKEIEKQPVTNPLQALQGRTPGIYINQMSGVPGSNFEVRIRGTNSIQNGNNPLYVIDGIPFISESMSYLNTSVNLLGVLGTSPLNNINPNDIESIEILKDADATAIYGSRGANGVVLITTKKGKSGNVKVDINIKSGISKVTPRLDLMNTQQYIAMRMEAVENDGTPIRNDEYDINGTWDQSRYTDWQDVFLGGTAAMNDINASVSGGNNETQFLFGAGYNSQSTVFPGDDMANRWSTNLSVVHTSPDKKFNTRLSTGYSINRSNIVASDYTLLATALSPNAPKLYNENGELNWENGTWSNPLAELKNRLNINTYNLIMSAELGYEVIRNFRIKTSIGINDIRNEEKRTFSSESLNPSWPGSTPASSELRIGAGTNRSWIIEPQANWEKKIAKGKLSVLVGGTYQQRIGESSENRYRGFPSNTLINDPRSAAAAEVESYSLVDYKYAAIYGRINYTWDEKYILNITGRRDGSSRFGPGKKFANLGAVGFAWLFSNEAFIKNGTPFLSFGKLRGSYGITGNDQIGDYRYLDTYRAGSQYHGITSLVPSQLYNPDYGWETNKKLEGAVELGFLNDRIFLTLAYYYNRSSNQLIAYRLAATTGNPSVLQNSPASVQNTGFEADLTTVNISKGGFKWTSSFNVTVPRNKLVAFPNLESSSYATNYILGKPLTIQKAYHYLGVDPATGIYQFEDTNEDGEITLDDRQSLVEYGQQYYGGINNSISYKGFQVDILFQFVGQKGKGYIFSAFGAIPGDFYDGKGTQPVTVLDGRWQNPGDQATGQYFSRSAQLRYTHGMLFANSDGNTQDIRFVRLKNVSVSYQFPHKILGSMQCKMYLQGQNLLTFTNYAGLDPETGSASLPPLTTVIIGTQLTF